MRWTNQKAQIDALDMACSVCFQPSGLERVVSEVINSDIAIQFNGLVCELRSRATSGVDVGVRVRDLLGRDQHDWLLCSI
jgi:hypothetical protein